MLVFGVEEEVLGGLVRMSRRQRDQARKDPEEGDALKSNILNQRLGRNSFYFLA